MKAKQFIFLSEKFGQGENIKVFKPENGRFWTMTITTDTVTDKVIDRRIELKQIASLLANARNAKFLISKQIITV